METTMILPMHCTSSPRILFALFAGLFSAQVFAQGIVPANNLTQVTRTANGVPVVSIATPNANGISHNRYLNYNVGAEGLIINNSTGMTQTQLGGQIGANPNLVNGAARMILNEVPSGISSRARRYTEIAGNSPLIVFANPHGFTCDGCGFINTPRTISYDQKSNVRIDDAMLNVTGGDWFDIIKHSKYIDTADSKSFVIDSFVMGGMYVGAVFLVRTDKGVGVSRVENLGASVSDVYIDANGRVSLKPR
jgi:filamentous hemagglutinin